MCSGLILLQVATLYYHLIARLDVQTRRKRHLSLTLQILAGNTSPYPSDPRWTGTSGLLAQQRSTTFRRCRNLGSYILARSHLSLDEDPLAFLGIPVDGLQATDRYFVFALPDRVPIQGADVYLEHKEGRIILDLAEAERAGKVRKDLNAALVGWEDVVEVLPI